MAANLRFNGHDARLRQIRDTWAEAPVNDPAWQVKQQIDNAQRSGTVAAQEFRQEFFEFLANALDARGARKEGIENRRTHGAILLGKVLQRKCRSG